MLAVVLVALSVGAAPALPATWTSDVHVGLGRRGEDPVLLLQPRVRLDAAAGSVALAAPLWLRLVDLPPSAAGSSAAPSPLVDWRDTATYAGWIEDVAVELGRGAVRLDAGQLGPLSLGHGLLVDNLGGSMDPAWRESAAHLVLATRHTRTTLLTDDIARPHVVGGRVELAPLSWLGVDATGRLRLGLETAWDVDASHLGATDAPGGGGLDLSGVLWRSARVGLNAYVGSALMNGGAYGAHTGAELELAAATDPERAIVRLAGDVFAGRRDFRPGYFDAAYMVERWELPDAAGLAKHAASVGSCRGARLRLDARLGAFSLTLAGLRQHPDAGDPWLDASLRTGWQSEDVSVALGVLQREARAPIGLIRLRRGTHVQLESSVRLRGGWFGFLQATSGTVAVQSGGVRALDSWLVGVAYGGRS